MKSVIEESIATFNKGTRPEKVVRRVLSNLGYSYRLNVANLPGKPDIVNEKVKKIIFIHGCFWHSHACRHSKLPTNNRDYWENQLQRIQNRDFYVHSELSLLGYKVLIIWECETDHRRITDLIERVYIFMKNEGEEIYEDKLKA